MDKKAIPANERRRHTDPPSLWIGITITSVSLHLLVFWFMRSSNGFKPWFPQQNQTVVPIEFIEIYPTEKSPNKSNLKAETVSPKSSISPQQSASSPSPETAVAITPSNQDTEAVNSDASLLNESENTIEASQPNTKPFREKAVTTPTPTPTPTQTPTPTPTIPVDDLPWKRREEVVLGQGQPLPKDIPSIPPEPPEAPKVSEIEPGETVNTPDEETLPAPTGETVNTPDEETLPSPTGETVNTPDEETLPSPTGETVNTPDEKGTRVTFTPINRTEIEQLIQEGKLTPDGLPDVLAIHIHNGSNIKNIESSYIPGNSVLEPAQFLVSLVIDNNGNFQQSEVLEIEPARLQSEKSLYEQLVNDTFRNDRFLPGENNDGTKPELSNLFMRIIIDF
jgi:hypothetical protein